MAGNRLFWSRQFSGSAIIRGISRCGNLIILSLLKERRSCTATSICIFLGPGTVPCDECSDHSIGQIIITIHMVLNMNILYDPARSRHLLISLRLWALPSTADGPKRVDRPDVWHLERLTKAAVPFPSNLGGSTNSTRL